MGHLAKIDENNIVQYVVVAEESDSDWLSKKLGGIWIRTSYNTFGGVHYNPENKQPSADQSKSFRFNFANVGYTYNPNHGPNGAFIPPKPFESWLLNEDTCLWEPPVPMPEDENTYVWNEATQSWDVVSEV